MSRSNILIVDDEPENLDVLTNMVEEADELYDVYQAHSGTVALNICLMDRPDLIITDWEMPGMSGIELIKTLKSNEETSAIPIIMCTGMMTDSKHLGVALEAGAVDYIRKPVDIVELTARIKSMLALSDSYQVIRAQNKELEIQKSEIVAEKDKSDELLLNILPREISEELKKQDSVAPQYHTGVTILFTDFIGFTGIAERTSPQDLVARLHDYFSRFDGTVEAHGLEKIKTIGDAYMCAAGVPSASQDSAVRAVHAAFAFLKNVDEINEAYASKGQSEWKIRLGMHTGDVVAGVVGKKKFTYDIWGDAVNLAARMETAGAPGKINISESTYKLIQDDFECTERGKIEAKNKGEVSMYFVDSPKRNLS